MSTPRIPVITEVPCPISNEIEGRITKRDGRHVPWNSSRLTRAAARALASVHVKGEWKHLPNYGLSDELILRVLAVTRRVERQLANALREDAAPDVEEIQDLVEKALADEGEFEAAKSYILYRAARSKARAKHHRQNGLQDYIAISRYSRYLPELQRRELWHETVARTRDMHLRRFAHIDLQPSLPPMQGKPLAEQIRDAFAQVEARRVLPSMRSLQFGGAAIEKEEARMFNCAFTYINRIDAFKETLWLLLCGTGTGFSVQKQHIAQLPQFPPRGAEDDLPVRHHHVVDSIAGWADALDVLVRSYYNNELVEFDYSPIRDRGAQLVTSGGRAPGHVPLRRALEQIRGILNKIPGRHLKPIEAYDIIMFAAKAVLSGGIRRSATICLFSADDEEMMCAKTGNWFDSHPQRAASNNSAVINRNTTPRDVFLQLFEKQKEFGEPGFYFVESEEYGANPCVEIGLAPFAVLQDEDIAKLRRLGCEDELHAGQKVYGWQMCNLCTINAAACASAEEFYQACRTASFIGTLQATYTRMDYLGPLTRFINERESLLGVSITGILDNPGITLDPAVLTRGAEIVKEENARVAAILGIPRAARTTCVKPEGTASLLLGTSSGIHPHHAKRYFRRVQSNRKDPVYEHFHKANAHMTEPSVYGKTDDVIAFPVQARPGAITRDEVSAVPFLSYVKLVQEHWVMPGRARDDFNPGLHHNVSNTCVVRDSEWNDVSEFIWNHRAYFTGISLLPFTGDKIYAQAPNETVETESDIARWNKLDYQPVDYSRMREVEDTTELKRIAACAGGACELTLTPA